MKKILTPKYLPLVTLAASLLGLLLRIWLLGTDNGKGFIIRGHISAVLLYILTAAFIVYLFLATRPLVEGNKYRYNFPPSMLGAVGTLIAAFAFGVTSILEWIGTTDTLTVIASLLGIISMFALVFVAHCRWKGNHPSTLFHIVVCAYLMLRLICMYRQWSADPQLQDYSFQLLGIVCMMLAAYHRATFDANFGKRHSYIFFALASVYFCCLSLAGPDHILFFLGSAVWFFTNLCSLTPMKRKKQEKQA